MVFCVTIRSGVLYIINMKFWGGAMGNAYKAVYVLNIVFQSIVTLLMYIGASLLLSWLLVEKCGLPPWTYVVLIIIGAVLGFISMLKFILSAMNALSSLEKIQNEKRRKNGNSK